MFDTFTPDYRYLSQSARNIEAARLPLYEHNICVEMMEAVLGVSFGGLFSGDFLDKVEFFRHYSEFCRRMGYDAVTFEQ